MKIHTNVWDFRKVFRRNLHPFRDVFHKRLLSTFLSGIHLSLISCNKRRRNQEIATANYRSSFWAINQNRPLAFVRIV